MSYTIYFDKWEYPWDEYTNLSFEAISRDDDMLSRTEEFEYWFDENYGYDGLNIEEVRNGNVQDDNLRLYEIMDMFRESDSYYNLENSYTPIYNYVHILSSRPYDDAILMVEKYVGNVVVMHLNEVNADVLALTGCGMDLSDNLELAYYIMDGKSPIEAAQIMSLSKNAEYLLLFCRKKVKENDYVSINEMKHFIDAGYVDEEE